ncbi:hypothetical protein ACFWWA_30840 [Streptomyces goshikiensis]|uniref:hypothetical protein n=1 Tax=Streptomyces goshikiensis TaxID=1942 RepID=UPI00365A214D
MKDASDLIDALTALAWPLIAGLALWRLFPVVKEIARSRGFTVKVGGAELTVQEISDELLRTTADLQGRLAAAGPPPAGLESLPGRTLRRVLWVCGTPADTAYESAQLQSLGVDVTRTTTTRGALTALSTATPPFDALVTDLTRTEDGTLHPTAGLDLTRTLRARGHTLPVFLYTPDQQPPTPAESHQAGATATTTRPTTLFAHLHQTGAFPYDSTPA